MIVEYREGIYLPEIRLWLDAHSDRPGEAGFVSHAHGDHARWHGQTLLTRETLRLMRARRPRSGGEPRTAAFLQPFEHQGARLTLYPAGHIAGSAQVLVESGGERLLYSGDFKLRPDPACESIVIPQADLLIMETTFGLPRYLFPPTSLTMERLAAFCQDAIRAGRVPVLLAYSLGKAQELMLSLKPWGFEFVVHPSAADITEAYRQMGYAFPPCHVTGRQGLEGRVLVWPPHLRQDSLLQGLSRRVALVSGWALDSSARFRFGADECFPVSDHADFSELLAYVREVRPSRVFTQHGFSREFASFLRREGYDARALGQQEQLELI